MMSSQKRLLLAFSSAAILALWVLVATYVVIKEVELGILEAGYIEPLWQLVGIISLFVLALYVCAYFGLKISLLFSNDEEEDEEGIYIDEEDDEWFDTVYDERAIDLAALKATSLGMCTGIAVHFILNAVEQDLFDAWSVIVLFFFLVIAGVQTMSDRISHLLISGIRIITTRINPLIKSGSQRFVSGPKR